jgi:hypothetical protein
MRRIEEFGELSLDYVFQIVVDQCHAAMMDIYFLTALKRKICISVSALYSSFPIGLPACSL